MSDSLWPHELQHARPPCPSPTPGVHSDSCASSQWCHPAISSSVIPFSSYLQSFPASGAFQMSQFFTSGGQSIRISASTSVLPMNTQDWSPLGWTGWISLQSKGLLRVFSTVQKHQSFGTTSPSGSYSWDLEATLGISLPYPPISYRSPQSLLSSLLHCGAAPVQALSITSLTLYLELISSLQKSYRNKK